MKISPGILLLCFLCTDAIAQKPERLGSYGKADFIFKMSGSGPAYDIIYNDKPVITGGEFGLGFAGEAIFKNDLRVGKIIKRDNAALYDLAIGLFARGNLQPFIMERGKRKYADR